MMVAGNQAHTMWCPMVRHAISGDVFNRGVRNGDLTNISKDVVVRIEDQHYGTHCVGPRCMMWRLGSNPVWRSVRCEDESTTIEPPRPSNVPASWIFCPADDEPACWVQPDNERMAAAYGYCGLAGKPGDV